MSKKGSREKRWRMLLFLLIFIEVCIIGLLGYQVYFDSVTYPVYQLTGLLFLAVWIYIAFLKQKTVDVSIYALGEKFKTHALIQSIPLGAIILDEDNEILFGNSLASSLLGKEIMLFEDRDLGHCLPYDIMKNVYSNQWGGYVTRGLEGLFDVIVSITPIKDQNRKIIGKLLIIQGAESTKKEDRDNTASTGLSELCMTFVNDTEKVLRPAKPEVAQGTRIRALLMKNLLEREKVLANKGNAPESFGTLSDILIAVITDIKSAYASKKLTIKTDLHGKMLVKSPSFFVQALRELMINALLFSKEEGTVSISSKIEEDYFEVSVKDSGIGMKNEFLSEGFEDGFVGDNSDAFLKYRQGKGLPIVKELMEEVGVSVRLESKEGTGTMVVMSGQQGEIE